MFPGRDDQQHLCAVLAFLGNMPQELAFEGMQQKPHFFERRDGLLRVAWERCYDPEEFDRMKKEAMALRVSLTVVSDLILTLSSVYCRII